MGEVSPARGDQRGEPRSREAILAPFSSGSKVGDWVLERRLGSGAMGEVWLVHHATTRGRAALKRLHPEVASRDAVRRLFARERRAIAMLSHPHVVRLYDVGPDWIVTQYVEGSNLAHRLQTPIDPASAIALALQIASALAHAHGLGVVHRDVKPSNVLIDGRGNAYLADFGLASFVVDGERTEERAGTPAFMAPEQARGQVSPASDQYALGRTLLEMLAGGSVSTEADEAFRQLPAHLPRALLDALRRATAREPEARFPSIEDLAAALAAIDLRDYPAPFRLAPEVRLRTGFEWCTGPMVATAPTHDVLRAEYQLSDLETRGLLPRAACDAFRAASGYADITWSAYGDRRRLGPITETLALARAADLVVVLHGMLCSRDDWRDLAATLCRDNAQAVVLVPDILGCGGSVVAENVTRRELSGPGIVRATLAWLELLGVRELPTVLVGHSIAGAALLSAGDDVLGERIARVAITPMCPPRARHARVALVAYSWLLRALAGVPLFKRLLAAILKRWPDFQGVTDAVLERLEFEFLRASPRVLASLIAGFADTSLAGSSGHARCRVLVGDDDPVAPPELTLAALEASGFPLDHVEHLVGVGHHPVYLSRKAIEATARNLHDIARVVDALMSSSRDGSPLTTAVASTVIATASHVSSDNRAIVKSA